MTDKDLDFSQLHLSGLHTSYIINTDSTSNFDLVLDSYRHADSSDTLLSIDTLSLDFEEHKSWKVNIEDLALDGAQLMFEDHTLPETFHYAITDICLTSKHFSLDGYDAISMQAALNTVGKLIVGFIIVNIITITVATTTT